MTNLKSRIMKKNNLVSRRIVKAIHKDLLDRRGLKFFFDKNYRYGQQYCCPVSTALGKDVIESILEDWINIVQSELDKTK